MTATLTVYYLDENDKKQKAISTDTDDIKDVLSWWDEARNGLCLKGDQQIVVFVPFRRILLMELRSEKEGWGI